MSRFEYHSRFCWEGVGKGENALTFGDDIRSIGWGMSANQITLETNICFQAMYCNRGHLKYLLRSKGQDQDQTAVLREAAVVVVGDSVHSWHHIGGAPVTGTLKEEAKLHLHVIVLWRSVADIVWFRNYPMAEVELRFLGYHHLVVADAKRHRDRLLARFRAMRRVEAFIQEHCHRAFVLDATKRERLPVIVRSRIDETALKVNYIYLMLRSRPIDIMFQLEHVLDQERGFDALSLL